MYIPPDSQTWKGRNDGEGPAHFRYHNVVKAMDLSAAPSKTAQPSWALLGFASDEGVKRNEGRAGAAEGPGAIRKALANLPFHHEGMRVFDAGDVRCSDGDLEAAQTELGEKITALVSAGYQPWVLGGGHEVAFGHYTGLYRARPGASVGILNFDAHFDLRSARQGATSGTPFVQIHDMLQQAGQPFRYMCMGIQPFSNTRYLFDKADELGVEYISAEHMIAGHAGEIQSKLEWFLEAVDHVYVTICLDVFSAAVAPGVSAPNPIGVMPAHVLPWLKQVAQSGKAISFDIAEMNPAFDRDGITARLAAVLVDYTVGSLR